MKNRDLIGFSNLINTVISLKGAKFAYAIVKNIKMVQAELEILDKAKSEKFKEYDKKRMELAKKCAKKDKAGRPVINGNSYILEDRESFDFGLKELREEYKEDIKDYEDLMGAEANISLHKIKLEDIPSDITIAQMAVIQEFVVEDSKQVVEGKVDSDD